MWALRKEGKGWVLSIAHWSYNYKKAAEAGPDFSLAKKPVFLQGSAGVGLHKDTTATWWSLHNPDHVAQQPHRALSGPSHHAVL